MASPSITRAGTTEPFALQVAKGEINYHTAYSKFGSIASQDTNEAIINSVGYIPAYQTAAAVVKVSSGNINDTSAGTGARTVTIAGLDSTNTPISETITLNGQTAVNTVNSYLRVTEITILTVGGGTTSAGIIYAGTGTVTAGVPATVYLRIPASSAVGATTADIGCYKAVPAGYALYLTGLNPSATVSSNTATIYLKYRAFTSSSWTTHYTFKTSTNGSDKPVFDPPLKIAAGSEYEVTSVASGTTIASACTVYGYYIQNG